MAILFIKGTMFGKEYDMKVLFHEKRLQQIPVEEEFGCPSLQESMEKTRDALETAYAGFDNATDPELIDCYIYEINALLKKYTYLSQMAAKEHIPAPALNQRSPIRALISHVFG